MSRTKEQKREHLAERQREALKVEEALYDLEVAVDQYLNAGSGKHRHAIKALGDFIGWRLSRQGILPAPGWPHVVLSEADPETAAD